MLQEVYRYRNGCISNTRWMMATGKMSEQGDKLTLRTYLQVLIGFRSWPRMGYGVWNETGASITIFRPPTFQESIWFKLLCVLGGSLIVGVAFIIRMRQMILKVQLRMSERLVERRTHRQEISTTPFYRVFKVCCYVSKRSPNA